MTGCQAELCASNVALPEHVRAGRTCSGKATLRTGRLAGWDTQHTSMSPPLLWRLGSCSASHTAVMVQAPARGLSAGLLLTHDAWHPHWITLGPTPVKKDQEFARHRSAMVRLARGKAPGTGRASKGGSGVPENYLQNPEIIFSDSTLRGFICERRETKLNFALNLAPLGAEDALD